jgi:hypothetical protein
MLVLYGPVGKLFEQRRAPPFTLKLMSDVTLYDVLAAARGGPVCFIFVSLCFTFVSFLFHYVTLYDVLAATRGGPICFIFVSLCFILFHFCFIMLHCMMCWPWPAGDQFLSAAQHRD